MIEFSIGFSSRVKAKVCPSTQSSQVRCRGLDFIYEDRGNKLFESTATKQSRPRFILRWELQRQLRKWAQRSWWISLIRTKSCKMI